MFSIYKITNTLNDRIVSAETRKKISEGLKNFHNKSIDSTAESFRAIDISKPTIPQR